MNPFAALFYLRHMSKFSPLYKINPNLFPRKIILDSLDASEKIIFQGG
jgi:hypothetical protein